MTLERKWLIYYALILAMTGAAYAFKVSGARNPGAYIAISAILLGATIVMRVLISRHAGPLAHDSRSNDEALRAMAEDSVGRAKRP